MRSFARDVGCRYPGCNNTRFVDGHHIVHWADGGETSLENLVLLCRKHHRYVHEHGFGMERRNGELQFVRSDGRWVPDVPRNERIPAERGQHALVDAHVRAGVAIDEQTAVPRWDGSTPDYGWLVGSLMAKH